MSVMKLIVSNILVSLLRKYYDLISVSYNFIVKRTREEKYLV